MLSQHIERNYAAQLLASNAERVAQVEESLDALERIQVGGAAIDPEVVGQLVVRTSPDPPHRS
ncbi:hypothetical protein ACWD1Y_23200 [Streptomyces sp. NPDC002814]